jgi:predicted PurR-regulated permease PerM
VWGTLVIGLIDNLLRPSLVGKDIHLPDYVVLFTTVGGIALFGINGFVLGPVIAAMFLAAWKLFTRERAADRGTAADLPAAGPAHGGSVHLPVVAPAVAAKSDAPVPG